MPFLRCIATRAASAAFNMAADLYFMRQCFPSTITLRTYTWEPAAITIGYMQNAATQLNCAKLLDDGIDWIRRPTGGRAVLHKGDVTYSCIFPRTLYELGATVDTTATIIMQCLVAALESIGIAPEIQNSSDPLVKSGKQVKLPCFLAPNKNEIMIAGKKLIGSAQYRSKTAVLQHGSIPLSPENTTLPHYLQLDNDEAGRQQQLLLLKSSCINNLLPNATIATISDALRTGFSNVLGYPALEKPFTNEEYAAITSLMNSEHFKLLWCTPNVLPE